MEAGAADLLSILIYDAGGRLVERIERTVEMGRTDVAWDGAAERRHALPSGIYFYSARLGSKNQSLGTGKVVLVR